MLNAKPAGTPLAVNHRITPDEKGELIDATLYRRMIAKISHLIAVKRILRYLKGTPDLGLWYPNDINFDLTAYSDSDYGGCKRYFNLAEAIHLDRTS
ncbi:hypothetical protein E3N88_17923 [Mikania micrantha]|uniref:Reverse transcriptase Ty1/copia-type domain-containing protein n=1 Tax=Mikania micrantha TaxID=192012 RepID=A0A5N6NWA0_9ASTR|nr:hypothetical protein E3N88_17923 [Mikania micrantha]